MFSVPVSHTSFCLTLLRTDEAEFISYLDSLGWCYFEFFTLCLKIPFFFETWVHSKFQVDISFKDTLFNPLFSQTTVGSREKSHIIVITWLPGDNLCSIHFMVPPQVLWFRLQMSPKGHVLKAWSPICGALERWWIFPEMGPDGRKLGC